MLYVYDGDNVIGEVLEVLYGGYFFLKEGICILLNWIFVEFKLDNVGFFYSFSVLYYGVNNLGRCFWVFIWNIL